MVATNFLEAVAVNMGWIGNVPVLLIPVHVHQNPKKQKHLTLEAVCVHPLERHQKKRKSPLEIEAVHALETSEVIYCCGEDEDDKDEGYYYRCVVCREESAIFEKKHAWCGFVHRYESNDLLTCSTCGQTKCTYCYGYHRWKCTYCYGYHRWKGGDMCFSCNNKFL